MLINQDTDSDELSRKAVELLLPAFEKARAAAPPTPEHALPAYASGFAGHYAGQFGEADTVIRNGRLLLVPDEASGGEAKPWLLDPEDEETLRIVSGSGDFDGQTIGFRAATATEPAALKVLGVFFPRVGPSKDEKH